MSSSTAHERLEQAWRERGEGFARHWASCTAQTRTRLLAAARDLLRKRVSGGRPQQPASDADGFLALCPELADAKLPRMAQGDMLPKLITVRVDHGAACREHDMRYVSANVGGGGGGGDGGGEESELVATMTDNRGALMMTFLLDMTDLLQRFIDSASASASAPPASAPAVAPAAGAAVGAAQTLQPSPERSAVEPAFVECLNSSASAPDISTPGAIKTEAPACNGVHASARADADADASAGAGAGAGADASADAIAGASAGASVTSDGQGEGQDSTCRGQRGPESVPEGDNMDDAIATRRQLSALQQQLQCVQQQVAVAKVSAATGTGSVTPLICELLRIIVAGSADSAPAALNAVAGLDNEQQGKRASASDDNGTTTGAACAPFEALSVVLTVYASSVVRPATDMPQSNQILLNAGTNSDRAGEQLFASLCTAPLCVQTVCVHAVRRSVAGAVSVVMAIPPARCDGEGEDELAGRLEAEAVLHILLPRIQLQVQLTGCTRPWSETEAVNGAGEGAGAETTLNGRYRTVCLAASSVEICTLDCAGMNAESGRCKPWAARWDEQPEGVQEAAERYWVLAPGFLAEQ